jgi:hypothetical protein
MPLIQTDYNRPPRLSNRQSNLLYYPLRDMIFLATPSIQAASLRETNIGTIIPTITTASITHFIMLYSSFWKSIIESNVSNSQPAPPFASGQKSVGRGSQCEPRPTPHQPQSSVTSPDATLLLRPRQRRKQRLRELPNLSVFSSQPTSRPDTEGSPLYSTLFSIYRPFQLYNEYHGYLFHAPAVNSPDLPELTKASQVSWQAGRTHIAKFSLWGIEISPTKCYYWALQTKTPMINNRHMKGGRDGCKGNHRKVCDPR